MNIVQRPSPNFNDRPGDTRPSLIILHGTAGTSDAGDVSWCTVRQSKVSYHYIIGRDGQIYQLVQDDKRAWHAGQSEWNGRANCNDYSIGIGFSNNGVAEPYTKEQYESGHALLTYLRTKHDIPLVRVVGHCHVSPGRKTDPWLKFEWMRLV